MFEGKRGRIKVKTITVFDILICCLGISAPFGEGMNIYFPYASKIFLSFCFFVLILSMLNREIFSFHLKNFKTIMVLIAYFIIFQMASILLSQTVFSLWSVIELFKLPIFLMLALMLSKMFCLDVHYFDLFLKAFIIGFLVAIPFGNAEMFRIQRFCGTYTNPNTYAEDCLLCMYSVLFLMRKKRWRYLEMIVFMIAFGMLVITGSRGALLSVAFGIFLLIIDEHKISFKNIIIFMCILMLAGILFYYLNNSNIPLMQRFSVNSYGGNVRWEIWKAYLSNMDQFFWFGINEETMTEIHKFTPHNAMLGVFVRYGIIALIMYIVLIIKILVCCIRQYGSKTLTYQNKVLCCMFVTFFLSGLTLENLTFRTTVIFLAVGFSLMVYRKNTEYIFAPGRS